MKKQSLLYCGLLMAITLVMFFSCRKEVTNEPPFDIQESAVIEIRNAFEQSGLKSKLSSRFHDSLSLNLSPVWANTGQQKVSDSITYFYVPLVHFLTDPDGKLVNLRTAGFEEFLIIRENRRSKESLKFFKAKYARTDTLRCASRGRHNYDSFTGYDKELVLISQLASVFGEPIII